MTAPVATVLLVFGRGVTTTGGRYELTPAGAARVDAAVGYVLAHPGAFAAAAAPWSCSAAAGPRRRGGRRSRPKAAARVT